MHFVYVGDNIPLKERRNSSSRRVCMVLMYGLWRIRRIALGILSSSLSSESLPVWQNLKQWGICAALGRHSPRVRRHVTRISLRYGCIPHLPASKDIAFVVPYHGSSLLIITPSNLVDVTLSIVFSLIVIAGLSGGMHHRNTISSFVLSQLTHTMVSSCHSTASVAVCWIWLSSADGEHTSHSVLYSTYLYSGNLVCRSFMWTI